MTKRNLSELLKFEGLIYIYLKDSKICKRFYSQAESEGFMFGDGKPTEKHTTDLVRLYQDKRISYCSTNGRIAFGSGKGTSGNIFRVDYSKFISGENDYLFRCDSK